MNVNVCYTHLKSELDYQMLLYIFLFTQIDGKTLQKQFSGWKKSFRSKRLRRLQINLKSVQYLHNLL